MPHSNCLWSIVIKQATTFNFTLSPRHCANGPLDMFLKTFSFRTNFRMCFTFFKS